MIIRRKEFWLSVLAGAVFGMGSCVPQSTLCVLLGWLSAVLFCYRARDPKYLVFDFFVAGITFHLTAFHWLYHPIHFFGGFAIWLALILQLLFALVSSLQFALCGWLTRRLLDSFLEAWLLAFPIAWWCTEFLTPRMFPWVFSHTQADFLPLSALAEYAGAYPVSVLMFWAASAVLALIIGPADSIRRLSFRTVSPLLIFAVALGWGEYRTRTLQEELAKAPTVKIGVVQGNLDIYEKGDLSYLSLNLERYQTLSEQAIKDGAEVLFWPESISSVWINENLDTVRGTRADPFPNNSVPLLYGGLSLRLRKLDEVREILSMHSKPQSQREIREAHIAKKFNSAIAIDQSGNVGGVYHKRILMPFGEYIPFADRYPELKKLSPQTADFSVGDKLEPIELALNAGRRSVKVAPLICYEDLIPGPTLEGVRRGADLLVNLTNDAWYGDTAAPHQHHLIARWRAIESRRTLVRATNTGLTAVVDPLGQTVRQLPVFEPAYLVYELPISSIQTCYSRIGDLVSWVVSALAVLVLCGTWLSKRSK